MKLIYADTLIEDILALPNCPNGFSDTYDKSCIIGVIEEQPTIEERKKGKWYKPNGVMPPEHFGRHRCSICDAFAMHDWKHHREQLTDYCPNCGADMRGDDHATD